MKKKTKNLLVLIVILAIVGIAVGYAALSQKLTLNGTATTKSSSDWNIHFGLMEEKTRSTMGVEASNYTLNKGNLTGTFSATLIPGGSITYTVTVVNDGTIDAEAENPVVTLDGSEGVADYIECTVTPNTNPGALPAGATHTYDVTLKYIQDDLPTTPLTATATVDFNYVQKAKIVNGD